MNLLFIISYIDLLCKTLIITLFIDIKYIKRIALIFQYVYMNGRLAVLFTVSIPDLLFNVK